MAALFAAFVLLFQLVAGHTAITIHDGAPFLTRTVGSQVTYSLGYVTCWSDGRSEVHLPQTAAFTTWVHELAHAYDCADDGELNGSPMPEDSTFVGAHRQCVVNSAQRYACYVEETGDVGTVSD